MSIENYRENFFFDNLNIDYKGPGKKLGVKYYGKKYVICAYLLDDGYTLKLLDFVNRKEQDKKIVGDITNDILELLEDYHTKNVSLNLN